ncbi:penicillin-binding protein, transpeptidase domain protein [Catonella morbi ATCC 51271]|uniref:Penicillin-binding protein, transpeptidase domain protein n=1 Tax=Catonella morbi ATCC 51271 TaxID=592026 RepID=V2Y1V6_9FIRM|nr:penicillin-binding protein 2 [Catonella morbi]ESL02062.1 penicillin-binding protein, transpeptidase domain protein [Catonella morbi ATCC 51271]
MSGRVNNTDRRRRAGRKNTRKKRGMTIKKKILMTAGIFALAFVGISIAVINVAHGKGDGYKKKYLSQQTYSSNPIIAKRGDILDRRGVALAKSVLVYNFVLEPKIILAKEEDYKEPTIKFASEYFGISADELKQIIEKNPDSMYQVVKKEISFDEKEKFVAAVNEFNKRDTKKEKEDTAKDMVMGYNFEGYYKRTYPLKTVASDVVGFTYSGDTAEWGIEGYYNSKLNGKNGVRYGYFNSNLELEETEIEAKNGLNIVTTIDSDAQKLTEDIIANYQKTEGAQNVGIIVMNPNNGEIYVMASNKGYDLNNPRDLSPYFKQSEIDAMNEDRKLEELSRIWKNYCTSDIFEPGSTFKPFTVAACLEKNVIKQNDTFYCDGFEDVMDRRIRCVKRDGHGMISLSKSLEQSCNDVMMQIVRKLGKKDFARYQNLFGIGSRTGIDYPGETTGLAYNEEQLNPVELATSSFGQGVSVTMIQMAAGFSSIVNGGTYYKPHLVKELVNDAGVVVEKNEPVVMKKTVTKDTAEFIQKALYETVENGTGWRAKTAGYKLAGKTGTAQKLDNVNGKMVRSETNYVLSFIGCAPYDNPQAVVYVVVDQPHIADQTATGIASALAHEVVEKVFKVLGVYPEKVKE